MSVGKGASLVGPSLRSLCWVSAVGAVALFPLATVSAQVVPAQQPAPRQIPAAPSFRQFVPGLLARTRFVAEAPSNRRVELWDLLVGPAMRSAPATFPGGAVIEIRAGSGRISIDGREQELRPGATLSIPDGTSFQLVNTRDDLGLSIRATVIIGRQP